MLETYKTLVSIIAALLTLGLITDNNVLFFVGWAIAMIGAFSDYFAKKLVTSWLWVTKGIMGLVTKLVLILTYTIVLVPISAIYKLLSADPLRLKKPEETMYSERNHVYEPEDFTRAW